MLLFPCIAENSLLANWHLLHVSETKLFVVFICFAATRTPVLRLKNSLLCLTPEGTNVTCLNIILKLSFESSAFQLFPDSVKYPSDYLSKK